jgi:hypothetical protein
MWACATGVPTFPTWSGRCAPTAWKRPRSSAWRRRTRAPAWASTAAPSRRKQAACASTSPRAGRSIRCCRGLCRAPAPGLSKLSARWARRFRCCSPPTASHCRTVQPPRERRPAAPLAGQGADPYAEEARTPPRWSRARCLRFRAGGLPSRARAPAAVPWIGPSVERPRCQIAAEGVKGLILQPIGFLCDHVEILYDVDILFREYAAKLGIRLERPESLNASPTLARAVADLARQGRP